MTVVDHGLRRIAVDAELVAGLELEPHALAKEKETIRRDGVKFYPLVRASTGELLSGHLTMAALVQLGHRDVKAHVLDGTDAEIASLKADLFDPATGEDRDVFVARRHAEHVREYMESTGKRRGASEHATLIVARESGLSVEAVKSQLRRAARRIRHKRVMKDRTDVCPVECWDREVDRDFRTDLHHLIDHTNAIKSFLTRAKHQLEAMSDAESLPISEHHRHAVWKAIEAAQRAIVRATPAATCPQCGHLDAVERKRCRECRGTGYLSVDLVSDPTVLNSRDRIASSMRRSRR